MRKTLNVIAINAFIIFIIYMIFSNMNVVWKMLGYSFVNMTKNGSEIVYKGKVIAIASHECIVSYTKDLEEVEIICSKHKVKWIKGVSVND